MSQPSASHMEQHNGCDSFNSTITSRAPTALGTLGKLPLELRCKIYEPLFKAGSIAITRVSKTMHKDTRASLSEHCVYHVTITRHITRYGWCSPDYDYNFDCSIAGVAFDPSSYAMPTYVANLALDFRPKPSADERPLTEKCTQRLRDVVVGIIAQLEKTKHCRLTFGVWDPGAPVVAALKKLQNFKCVTVEMISRGPYPCRKVAEQRHDLHFVKEERMLAAVSAALGAPGDLQGSLKATVSLTTEYLDQDNWVRGLGKTETDDPMLYRLSKTEAYHLRHNPYFSILSDKQMEGVREYVEQWIETHQSQRKLRSGT